jgi:hypothetical protein
VSPDDRRLARRLTREARVAGLVALRTERAQARAIARAGRRRRRARRHLGWQVAVAAWSFAAVLTLGWGDTWLVVGAGFSLLAARSVARLLQAPVVPAPVAPLAPRVPPPPAVQSAAFPAVRRLEAAREAMARLLPLVAPAGRDAADDAWRCAADNDAALRWQAARLAAVEPHRGAEPALMDLLYGGVVAQERLVAGLADLVSASADPHAVSRLQDATDALHGLASGLREVR